MKRIYDMLMSVRWSAGEESEGFFKNSEIMSYLNEGLEVVTALTAHTQATNSSKTLVASQQEYSAPADCKSILMITVAGKPMKIIDLVDLQAENSEGVNATSEGTPTTVYHFNDMLGMYPIPATADAAKVIKVWYEKYVVSINAETYALTEPYIIKTTAVTVNTSNVSCTTARATEFIASGDYFGVMPDKWSMPRKWYRIKTAPTSNTGFTISASYTGVTNSNTYSVICKAAVIDNQKLLAAQLYAIWKTSRKYKDPAIALQDYDVFMRQMEALEPLAKNKINPRFDFIKDRDNFTSGFFKKGSTT